MSDHRSFIVLEHAAMTCQQTAQVFDRRFCEPVDVNVHAAEQRTVQWDGLGVAGCPARAMVE